MALLDPLRRPPPPPEVAPHDRRAVWHVVAVIVAYNVVANLWLPLWMYVPANLGAAGLLLWLAHRDGVSWRELGMSRAQDRDGLRVGFVVVAVVLVVVAIGVLIPWTRHFFSDDRVGDASVVLMLYHVFVRIPWGTVVLEEVAFRGVLLGLLRRHVPTPWAVTWSSLLFGLWHVIPGYGAATANEQVKLITTGSLVGLVFAVVFAVLSTAIAGVVFCWIRLRADSLVASMLAHMATNSIAYAAAWVVLNAGI